MLGLGLGLASSATVRRGGGPSLDLNFLSGALDPRITFSRTSSATYFDAGGVLRTIGYNLLLASENFQSWAKSGVTITSDATLAPDGSMNGDLITSTASTGRPEQTVTIPSGATLTFSIHIKGGSLGWARLRFSGNSEIAACWLNLSTLAAGQNNSTASMTITNLKATAEPNGWVRCSATIATAGFTSLVVAGYAVNSNNANGSIGDAYHLFGGQLETGSVVNTYSPTTTSASGGPRFDHDPVTLQPRGLLVEEARTNMLSRSEEFDQSWAKGEATITANAINGPTGTLVADKMVESATASVFHYLNNWASKPTTSAQYTFSIWVQDAGRQVQVTVDADGSNGAVMRFNPATGVVTANAAVYGSFTAASGTVTNAAGGWYRVAITATSGTEATIRGQVSLHNGTAGTYTGNGTSGVFLFGAQLEAGSFATSYIPTTTAAATRSADNPNITTVSPWYNQAEGTAQIEVELPFQAVNPITAVSFGMSDGTFGNSVYLSNTNNGDYLSVASGSVTQATAGVGTTLPGVKKIAGAYKLNDFAYSRAGGAVVTDTSGTVPPAATAAAVGKAPWGTSNYLNGYIRRVRYWPVRKPNAELQSLTA
jgi:hypothetical protein